MVRGDPGFVLGGLGECGHGGSIRVWCGERHGPNGGLELYEESFGAPDDQAEPTGPTYGDSSLDYLDRRDVRLEHWRFRGLFFPATLVLLGKAWAVAADVLLLAGILAFGPLGFWLVSIVLLVIMLVLAIYEYTSLGQ